MNQQISEQLEYLSETKAQIKQAIIDKGQSIPADTPFRDYVGKIEAIQTGVDTTDATATASDILAPKSAYVNNIKLQGTIQSRYRSVSNVTQMTQLSNTTTWLDYRPDIGYALTNENTLSIYDIKGETPVKVATYSSNIMFNNDAKFAPEPCYISDDEQTIIYNIYVGGMGMPSNMQYYRALTAVRFNVVTGAIYSGSVMSTSLYYNERQSYSNVGYYPAGGSGFVVALSSTVGAVMQKYPSRVSSRGDTWIQPRIIRYTNTSYSQMAIAQTGSGANYNHSYKSEEGNLLMNFCGNNQVIVEGFYNGFTSYRTLLSRSDFNVYKPIMLRNTYYYNKSIYNDEGASIKDFDSSPFQSEANYKLFFTGFIFEFETSTGNIYKYTYDEDNLTITFSEVITNSGIRGVSIDGVSLKAFPYSTNNYIMCWNSNLSKYFQYQSVSGGEQIVSLEREGIFYQYLENCNLTNGNKLLKGTTAYGTTGKVFGSMQNNGALSYSPSTSAQSIPAGYTSGGTIDAVTNAIDENIQAGNIKKDVTILGVTGTYESYLTEAQYNTLLAKSETLLA